MGVEVKVRKMKSVRVSQYIFIALNVEGLT